jgi:hypothetical protein
LLPKQTIDRKLGAGIGQNRFGAHHKHSKPLHRSGQQVFATNQHDIGVVTDLVFKANETGLHAAFGITKSSQPRFLEAQQRKVLGELALQEFGVVVAGDFDDAQMIKSGNAILTKG